MGRKWVRSNTLTLMLLVVSCAVLLGVLRYQRDVSPLHTALGQLRNGDAADRVAAVRQLGGFRSEAGTVIPALVAALRDPDEALRSETLVTLTSYGEGAAGAVPALGSMLREDRLIRFRRLAAQTLGEIRSPSAVPKLIEALQDEDPTVRREVALALDKVGPGASAAIPHLIGRLERDSSEDVRLACLDALIMSIIRLGGESRADVREPAIRARADALRRDPSAKVRARAAFILATRPSEILITALIEALDDPSREVRVASARSLAYLGTSATRVLPALARSIRAHREPRDLGAWVTSLRMDLPIDGPALDVAATRSFVQAIVSLLELRDVEVRDAAIRILFEISRMGRTTRDSAWRDAAHAATRAVLAMLEDDRADPGVRVSILDAIPAEWSPGEVEGLSTALTKALASRDTAVRTRAVITLVSRIVQESDPSGGVSWRVMIPVLMAEFKDHGMGPEPEAWARNWWREMVPVLRKSLEDPAPDFRRGAARVLDELGPEARVARVLLGKLAVDDPDADVRRSAAHSVESIDTPSKLKDPRPEVRREAATALGRMGWRSAPAVPDLIAALDDPDVGVRVEVIRSLGRIGPDAGTAIPALRRLVDDDGPDGVVRTAAREALKAILRAAQMKRSVRGRDAARSAES